MEPRGGVWIFFPDPTQPDVLLFIGGAIVLGVVAFRFFSSEIYDMLIVHMTARWYAATFLKLDAGMKVLDVGIKNGIGTRQEC